MRRAAVALAALALVAAGCGGNSALPAQVQLTPQASVKKAAKATAQATSEHVSMTATATVTGQVVKITGEGDFDNAKKVGTMEVKANLQGLDLDIEEVLDGTNVYMRSPLFSAALPAGKTWMKIDLQQYAKSSGLDFSSLLSQNPTDSFAQLQKPGSVRKVGDETIGGADTTHYSGRLDAAKLPKSPALKGLKVGAYDVWIGKDDGYIRRFTTSYAAAGQHVDLSVDYTDFGKAVTVTVPPASETVDATAGIDKTLGG